ncbi:glucan biosynthesis protein G [Roseomonas frigidaquae]|uniref:Glucan biosynthesis protein G n=1 Tax=Falsiroseomonas frigidaquae TaxID=487318 RepID=A0ABX1F167_9PROT|nr:glucan biosynthesis protein G [Falsiroseomonas frigidaquae]NKE46080.1 glucan biosynthesis protein G [Falsiroseomonas frigidaquae]
MHRRTALAAIASSALFLRSTGDEVEAQSAAQPAGTPFSDSTVRDLAREMARRDYRAPSSDLPRAFTDLGYDEYRTLRFNPQAALWRGNDASFQVQLFHRGFLYAQKVELHEVVDRRARPIPYDPAAFTLGERPAPGADFGHAGFRIHHPLNTQGVFDELAVFLGASYFRAVGRGLSYGLSARGLAIKTADPAGEEFPVFRAFWLERPHAGANSVVVHALLDSPSATAAFRFTIRPGDHTVFDVQAVIYPRVEVVAVGVAPLTSMYFFAPNDRGTADDYRNAVHDSDGLMIATSRGEQLWRPLQNPRDLQVSQFAEVNPRGFGLMQRRRDYLGYNDLEALYERRPSLWVEPIADWGAGRIQLIEIPTDNEINDNIVAFWRPEQPMLPGEEYNFVYRLHWMPAYPGSPELAQFTETRVGAAGRAGRLFVLDVAGGKAGEVPPDTTPSLDLSHSAGEIRHAVVQRNPQNGGWRVHFELVPGAARQVELRAVLKLGDQPLTETWLYRWTV